MPSRESEYRGGQIVLPTPSFPCRVLLLERGQMGLSPRLREGLALSS